MATYVNDLRLKEITTGDESGTWGTSTNTNLELIAEAFSYGTEVITTNADTHTTTIADGATDPGRSLYLKYTGTLDSACTITIGPNTVSKVWIIENGTSGSQDIIISQGSGANITIPAGDTKVVYSDGAGAGAAFFDAFASLSVVDLKVQDDLTVTDDASIGGDATITGTLGVTGVFTGTSLDISGDIDVDGTTNLDVVDIDGALTQDGGAVFNEASADVDFRVESDNDANALFVQGSDGFVGIGTASPTDKLHIGTNSGGTQLKIQSAASSNNCILHTNGTTDSWRTGMNLALTDGSYEFYDDVNNVSRMVIDSSGSVGIGTDSPTEKLSVVGGHVSVGDSTGVSGTEFLLEGYREIYNGDKYGNTSIRTTYNTGSNASDMLFYTASGSTNTDERVRIDSGGHLLVGKTSGTAGNLIETDGRISAGAGSAGQPTYNCEGDTDTGINLPESNRIQLITNGVEAMRVAANGFIAIGSTGVTTSVSGAAGPTVRIEGANPEIIFSDTAGTANQVANYYINNQLVWYSPQKTGGAGTVMSLVTTSGNFNVVGALSKGSGSFKIDHPLESKTDTHHLVHSFIEGPQADLIYRGKVDLVAGSATANIDTVAGMTEGTFVALNREVQCFTTNESNWDAVKGSVSGNILTIESENSESTATISWLVIGERKDQHMYDTDWTDDDGKVMVEPLKTDEE
jgi:hypothetical protein